MSTATERPKPQVDEIERSIDSFFGGLGRAWKKLLILAIVIGLIWFVIGPNIGSWWQYILYGAFMLFQLLFAILFMIVQFAALFWFLARGRTYWVQPGETGVGFKDYKGNPEVLEAASRVVTLLKGVKEFKQMGGQVTRGILLVGPPGTGKSYLAQCISTEAGVPFGYASAPSFQNMFFGVSNLTVMMLYRKARNLARKHGACILFIDEIDAIGMSRMGSGPGFGGALGGFFGGGTGLLNELLLQMDPPPHEDSWFAKLKRSLGLKKGASERPLVLTIGATNIAQTLDPALLRPGRFDRKIFVDYPDYDGRKEIIKYYLDKVAHEEMDLDRLASETIGQSPAAIKFIINEAVINAHFNGRAKISYEDFAVALDNHEVGLRHPIRNMLMEEKRALAYHEAGHAVAMLKLYKRMRVTRVTIIRHEGGVLGFAMPKPVQETYTTDRNELLAHIQVALAARASEELFLGTQLSGVFADLQQATRAAAAYIGYLGMNGSLYSTAAFGEGIDPGMKREIDKLLREQFLKVKSLLNANRELVVAIAETLLQRLELNGDDLLRIEQEVERRKLQGEELPSLPEMDAPVSVLELLPTESASTAAYQDTPNDQ